MTCGSATTLITPKRMYVESIKKKIGVNLKLKLNQVIKHKGVYIVHSSFKDFDVNFIVKIYGINFHLLYSKYFSFDTK